MVSRSCVRGKAAETTIQNMNKLSKRAKHLQGCETLFLVIGHKKGLAIFGIAFISA